VLLEELFNELAERRHLLPAQRGEVPAPKREDLIRLVVDPVTSDRLRFEAALEFEACARRLWLARGTSTGRPPLAAENARRDGTVPTRREPPPKMDGRPPRRSAAITGPRCFVVADRGAGVRRKRYKATVGLWLKRVETDVTPPQQLKRRGCRARRAHVFVGSFKRAQGSLGRV
jgi:hypothetical protein